MMLLIETWGITTPVNYFFTYLIVNLNLIWIKRLPFLVCKKAVVKFTDLSRVGNFFKKKENLLITAVAV